MLGTHGRRVLEVGPARHVSRREHVVGRVQRRVDDDAVVDLEPRPLEPARGGNDADAYDDDIGFERAAVVERDDRPRVALVDARYAGSRPHVHAVVSWSAAQAVPTWSPRTLPNGTARASRTVTSAPSDLAVAATSEPMKPPPTTTNLVASLITDASRRESSSVRSVMTVSLCCTPGRFRGCDPVAMTALSNSSREPSSSSIERA